MTLPNQLFEQLVNKETLLRKLFFSS